MYFISVSLQLFVCVFTFQEHGLDFEQLLNSSGYKEIHRARMIKWGEEKRLSDPYFFCSKTVETSDSDKPVWVISDARRKTDVAFFREHFPEVSKCVRLSAGLDVRRTRGFIFTPGNADQRSFCSLSSVFSTVAKLEICLSQVPVSYDSEL